MAQSGPHPVATRRAVEALLRDPRQSMLGIARRSGVSYMTVKRWNREARIRPWTIQAQLEVNPAHWTQGRLLATARLFARGDVDPGDIAEAAGCRRSDVAAVRLACGAAAIGLPLPLSSPGVPPDLGMLDLALRDHIGRQIVALDDRLRRAGPAEDTPRLLRDIGGLKRLLDDLSTPRPQDAAGDTDGEPAQDLAALRADLARRYAAFAGGGDAAGLPGEPSAGASGGTGA